MMKRNFMIMKIKTNKKMKNKLNMKGNIEKIKGKMKEELEIEGRRGREIGEKGEKK